MSSVKRKRYAVIVKGKSSFTKAMNLLLKRGFVFGTDRLRSASDILTKTSLQYANWEHPFKMYFNCDSECKMIIYTSRSVWIDGRTYKIITLSEFLKKHVDNL